MISRITRNDSARSAGVSIIVSGACESSGTCYTLSLLASLFTIGDDLFAWWDRELHKLGRAGLFGMMIAGWCAYSVASCGAYLVNHH